MPKRNLHPLPLEVNPVQERCLLVFVPDDDAYVQAVAGQLGNLGYWFNWERDPLKLGKDVAARWRESWQNTLDFWEEVDGDMCPLTINVNCGCCGSDYEYEPSIDWGQITPEQAEQILNLPEGLVDDGVNPPTANFPDYATYQDYKCATSIRLADDLLESFNRIGNLGGTLAGMSIAGATAFISSSLTSGFVGALAAFLTPFGAVAVILALIVGTFAVSLNYLSYFHAIRTSLDREELICALFTAQSPTNARTAVLNHFLDTLPGLNFGADDPGLFQTFLLNFMDLVAPDEIFRVAFDYVFGYDTGTGFDCSSCNPHSGAVYYLTRGSETITGDFVGEQTAGSQISTSCDYGFTLWAGDNAGTDYSDTVTVLSLSFPEEPGGWLTSTAPGGTQDFRLYYPNGTNQNILSTPLQPEDFPLTGISRIEWNIRKAKPSGEPCPLPPFMLMEMSP